MPRTTREIGAFIEREFGVVYESRSGLIAALHRLGLEYHKPGAWLTDVLTKLVNRWPARRIDELMPWAYATHATL